VFTGILAAPLGDVAVRPEQLLFFAAVAGFLWLSRLDRRHGLLRRIDDDLSLSVLVYGALVVAATLGAPEEAPAFIYFQF
ncbi:MAG: hypothetical protein JNK45_09275, partial [Myxococcales bacterium]|nr:hypothetical protein [Myxococcales bacterium]